MGTFRFLLAAMVVSYHAGWIPFGYSPGIIAVVSFFIISGFVTTKLIDNNYGSIAQAGSFYFDRFARIFPQYTFFLAVSFIGVIALGLSNSFIEGCNAYKLSLNLMVVPLGLYAFNDIGNCMVIPQAWSLGLELMFYATAPFLLRSPSVFWGCFASSVVVFLTAYTGHVDPDLWGYRLLPGTMFMFLTGSCFARSGALSRYVPWSVLALSLSLVAHSLYSSYSPSSSKEVIVGLSVGIPAVYFLAKLKFGAFDRVMGDFSYGLFLSHVLCIWAVQNAGFAPSSASYWLLVFGSSVVLAIAGFMIAETFSIKWRRSFRNAVPRVVVTES